MKETIALVLGFFVLAGSGRLFYLGYSRVCTRLQRGGAEEEKSAAPIAMVLTGFSLVTIFVLLIMVYTSLVTGIRLSMGSFVLAGLLLLVLNNLLLAFGIPLQPPDRQAESFRPADAAKAAERGGVL